MVIALLLNQCFYLKARSGHDIPVGESQTQTHGFTYLKVMDCHGLTLGKRVIMTLPLVQGVVTVLPVGQVRGGHNFTCRS